MFKVGDIVEFTHTDKDMENWGGCDNPIKKGLSIGKHYEVSDVEIHTWHTKISLKGFEGKFNSVSFELTLGSKG